jgi:hypothetical protein
VQLPRLFFNIPTKRKINDKKVCTVRIVQPLISAQVTDGRSRDVKTQTMEIASTPMNQFVMLNLVL